jgi:hypothetical protein
LSDVIELDPVAAGRKFARHFSASQKLDAEAIRNIRSNAQKLFLSTDPIDRWTAKYHRAFCDEIETLGEAQ